MCLRQRIFHKQQEQEPQDFIYLVRSRPISYTDPRRFSNGRSVVISFGQLLYRISLIIDRIAVHRKCLIGRTVNLRRSYRIIRPIFVKLRSTFVGRSLEPDHESIERIFWICSI
jgi:hypothetical protein